MIHSHTIDTIKQHVARKKSYEEEIVEAVFLIGCLANSIHDTPARHIATAIGIQYVTLRQAMSVAKHYRGDFRSADKALRASTRSYTWGNLADIALRKKSHKEGMPSTMKKLYDKTSAMLNQSENIDENTRKTAALLRILIDKHISPDVHDPLEI